MFSDEDFLSSKNEANRFSYFSMFLDNQAKSKENLYIRQGLIHNWADQIQFSEIKIYIGQGQVLGYLKGVSASTHLKVLASRK